MSNRGFSEMQAPLVGAMDLADKVALGLPLPALERLVRGLSPEARAQRRAAGALHPGADGGK